MRTLKPNSTDFLCDKCRKTEAQCSTDVTRADRELRRAGWEFIKLPDGTLFHYCPACGFQPPKHFVGERII